MFLQESRMDKPNILQREPLACLVSSVEEGGAKVCFGLLQGTTHRF